MKILEWLDTRIQECTHTIEALAADEHSLTSTEPIAYKRKAFEEVKEKLREKPKISTETFQDFVEADGLWTACRGFDWQDFEDERLGGYILRFQYLGDKILNYIRR